MGHLRSAVWVAAVVAIFATDAHAGYQDQKDSDNLGVVERALDKYQKDPSIFDGTAVVAGTDVAVAQAHAKLCDTAMSSYDQYYAQVSSKGRESERAKKVVSRHDELQPWCSALRKAVDAYATAQQQAAADRAAQADRAQKTCYALKSDAASALGGHLLEVLDTWRGARTPMDADGVKTFRSRLELLVPVCAKSDYADAISLCDGIDTLQGDSNQRYDLGDICAPVKDEKQTLTDTVMRLLSTRAGIGAQSPLSVDDFRKTEGWIQTTDALVYPDFFTVSDASKKKATAQIDAAFAAAGVDPPADLSMMWDQQQAYLDALEADVKATASEWKIERTKCKGYPCKLAEKSIQRSIKKAKVKKTYAEDWDYVKNDLGLPDSRIFGMWVLYQVKGEPYCQVRSVTVTEPYKGGGKYKKSKDVAWGYVRLQKC